MADMIPMKRAETFVARGPYGTSIAVQTSEIIDFDCGDNELLDHFVSICVDKGGRRLRLQVRMDGTWLLEEYDPEEDIPGDKEFQIVAGDLEQAFDTARYIRPGVRNP